MTPLERLSTFLQPRVIRRIVERLEELEREQGSAAPELQIQVSKGRVLQVKWNPDERL